MLGQGGFSKVYRVRDDVEGEERALKLFDNAAGYDAVRREIGALRKVDHPNVVKVYLGRPDRPRRVVPHHGVHRRRVARRLRHRQEAPPRPGGHRRRPRRPRRARRHPPRHRTHRASSSTRSSEGELSPRGVRRADGRCSENALVHRDIKPQNIMLTRTGAKLLDFNIASRVGDPVQPSRVRRPTSRRTPTSPAGMYRRTCSPSA